VLRSDMEVAKTILDDSDAMFKAGIDDANAKRELNFAQLRLEIERVLRSEFSGLASPFELRQRFRHNTKFKGAVNDVIKDLLESGTAESATIQTGGRPKDVVRLVEVAEREEGKA
jgi:hypothetical protein